MIPWCKEFIKLRSAYSFKHALLKMIGNSQYKAAG
jgi:hypothetical protein